MSVAFLQNVKGILNHSAEQQFQQVFHCIPGKIHIYLEQMNALNDCLFSGEIINLDQTEHLFD